MSLGNERSVRKGITCGPVPGGIRQSGQCHSFLPPLATGATHRQKVPLNLSIPYTLIPHGCC